MRLRLWAVISKLNSGTKDASHVFIQLCDRSVPSPIPAGRCLHSRGGCWAPSITLLIRNSSSLWSVQVQASGHQRHTAFSEIDCSSILRKLTGLFGAEKNENVVEFIGLTVNLKGAEYVSRCVTGFIVERLRVGFRNAGSGCAYLLFGCSELCYWKTKESRFVGLTWTVRSQVRACHCNFRTGLPIFTKLRMKVTPWRTPEFPETNIEYGRRRDF
jgi:hypothetical protein